MTALQINSGPAYWMAETSGVLAPAITAYLNNDPAFDAAQAAAMRAYLRQWIGAPVWQGGADLDQLRREVDSLVDRASISAWLTRAADLGIDPL